MSIDGKVHDLLGIPEADEQDLHTLVREQYAARPFKDPDVRMDIDYVLISRALEWGVTAAAGGVVGNAVYDGAKAALRAFTERRRFRLMTTLSSDEAKAFARYALAYAIRYQVVRALVWGTGEPPEVASLEKDGRDWVCRFEQNFVMDRHKPPALWVYIVEVKVDGRKPGISRTRCRTIDELRPLPPETDSAVSARSLTGDGSGNGDADDRQVSDWVSLGRQGRS